MEFPPLLALFYSEFHHIQGPKVVYEIPEGFVKANTLLAVSPGRALSTPNLAASLTLSPHPGSSTHASGGGGAPPADAPENQLDFDAISEYIIPKPVLCNRLVTISTKQYKVMGYPVSIESQKYERNALIYNLCFVFEKDADATSYEQIVRKMARVLRSLEVESEFLHNSVTKSNILNIMEQLIQDLNTYFECQIPINDANMINLKLLPVFSNPEPVRDWQVPVALVNIEKVMDKYWDMTIRRIVPFINGVFYVKKIAEVADVETDLVRIAIQHLLYFGCVKLVDIFKFSNVYAINHSLNGFLESHELQSECLQFVSKRDLELPPPSFAYVFRLYCSFKHGLTVKEWVDENNVLSLNIDIRRFIVFGIVKGFLYRVRKYPLWVPLKGDAAAEIDGSDGEVVRRFRSYLDGRCHYDQLCTEFQMSPSDLDEILGVSPHIRFIWR
ncbi:nitrogen permease regulator 2 [Chytridium lagenaria]|nr:nitrogen permease regulator 2 [Chytridium lagenaria]